MKPLIIMQSRLHENQDVTGHLLEVTDTDFPHLVMDDVEPNSNSDIPEVIKQRLLARSTQKIVITSKIHPDDMLKP